MAILEIACFNPEHAILAYEAGADRIELCNDREVGGTSPMIAWLIGVKKHVQIPIFVMVRPRGGDFTYSTEEMAKMRAQIETFKPHADGYVFGILDKDRNIDKAKTAELVALAHPLPCTFHRAFDETLDPLTALQDVIDTGCSAILTSGGAASAHAGIEILEQLVHSASDRITVIAGGSLRADNIAVVASYTGATAFHSSAILRGRDEPSADEIRQLKSSLQGPSMNLAIPRLSPSPFGDNLGDDDNSLSKMQMSAVSIGAVTPTQDTDKRL